MFKWLSVINNTTQVTLIPVVYTFLKLASWRQKLYCLNFILLILVLIKEELLESDYSKLAPDHPTSDNILLAHYASLSVIFSKDWIKNINFTKYCLYLFVLVNDIEIGSININNHQLT
jgi:hypothetical protein